VKSLKPLRHFLPIAGITALSLVSGCKTPTTTVETQKRSNGASELTNTPEQALVYVYREAHFGGSGGKFIILVDEQPITILANNSYFPLTISAGTHKLQYRITHGFVMPGTKAAFTGLTQDKEFETNFESGKTYYILFRIADVWAPRFESVSNNKGQQTVTNCHRAKPFASN
jgi:hypothetical protein